MSTPGKKDPKGCVAKTPRVLRARAVGNTYGVAFGTHIYAAACGSPPVAEFLCTKMEALPFYRKQGGKSEDLYDIADEGCALPGETLVADLEKSGWIRVVGGMNERWLPLQGSGLERIESPSKPGFAKVPPGWEILTWQACQGAVLKMVIAGFEWGADAAVVQDTVQQRLLRIGTKRNDRPGSILGDGAGITTDPDGSVKSGSDAVIIARPMIGVSWGEDVFDVAGLLNDCSYAAAAAAAFSVKPAQRELEVDAIEAGQQALAAEVRGWFAPSSPSNAELVRVATREAAALRRLWAHDLRERRLLRAHEGFVQIPEFGNEADEADLAEAGATAAMMAAAVAAEEEFDPVQIWVQVALGSILELAVCIPPQPGQTESVAFERLIARGTRTFSSAAPLSLFGAGRTSRLCVDETVSALGSLVESMPSLKPAGLEMLLSLATVTGSARLIAQALQWLLIGANQACAKRCIPNLCALWQLGSVMHFETLKVLDKNSKRLDRKKDPPSWRFAHLSKCGASATVTQRLRSHRTVSFEEPLPGGVYWEVTVSSADFKSIIVGVWLESKKKAVGCCLADGSAVGAGSESVPVEAAPEPRAGNVFGFVATAEELIVTCDGRPFSRILYKKLLVTGERVAVCVEQGVGTQIEINVGQEPLAFPPSVAPSGGNGTGHADSAVPPVIWGRACDPFSKCPYQPFVTEPETAGEVVDLLLQITERNIGRLGSSVDSGTPVQHTFAKTDQMNTTEDGTVVSNVRENSWARVDCEITVGVSVEFCFEVLDDRENDEGTCYGISTAECSKYDSRGSFVLRGYSGHLYCDGSDKGEKFPKIHPRSRVGFRFDYSEGKLEAWLDDQEPRLLLSDPNQFAGRTFFPTVFNYHGTRTKVKLLSCNSGLRSRAMLQDSFVLEVSAPAAALWINILEQLLEPVRQAVARNVPPGSAEVEQASGPIATVLKVLLAAANVSPNIWVEFGAVRKQLMQTIDFVVIEQRNDPALRQPRDIAILLISVLGVGALFGGPEQVLKVFLSVRDSEASRLGQTLVAYLLKTRRSASMESSLILSLSKLAVTDELSCQILLRLALNAFAGGADQLSGIAAGALALAERALADHPEVALGRDPPSFVCELLPVLAQLMAALPRREPDTLSKLLELLKPAAHALASIRKATNGTAVKELPRFITDSVQGLNAFMCGVACRLMATGDTKPFPLDIGDAELRDSAANSTLPKTLAVAEALIDEIAGPAQCMQDTGPALPEIISEILSGTGRGEALVCELHQKGQHGKATVSPVQRAAFAAAILCKGPDAWEAISSDATGAAAMLAWQSAQVFANNKVRPMKHSIAANEGDATAFEAGIASKLSWLVRSVAWPMESAPPPPVLTSRALTAPESSTRVVSKSKLSMRERMERMRDLGRMTAVEGYDGPPDWHLNLAKAQAQLVDEAASSAGNNTTDTLIASASAQRDVAIGRRAGLRILRHLVHGTDDAEGLEMLLPALHAALEDTLARPLAGLAHSGMSRRRAVLEELAGLLKDVFDRCSSSSRSLPTVGSLGLAMMCVPLPREELELLLGRLLGSLPALALDARSGSVNYCRSHAAQLVLRTYIAGRGRGGPVLSTVLAQIAVSLDSLAVQTAGPPLPSDSCLDPLEVDWDFGAFGRLSGRRLDAKAITETLSKSKLGGAQAALTAIMTTSAAAAATVASGTPPSAGANEGTTAEPTTVNESNEGAEKIAAIALTLKDLRQHRTSGTLPASVAANLLLRFPQASHEDAIADPVEVVQSLSAHKGTEVPWLDDGKPGACAAALTLLRPAADLITTEVPRAVERLLAVALGNLGQRLPACLAICLYMKLQLSDEQVAKDAPMLLAQLGAAEQVAMSTTACEGRCGALVFATMLARQLTSRANSMADAVLNALGDISMELPPTTSALAALNLIGGPMRCAACQMQVLNTSFGRSLVVAANAQCVAVLSLDGAADAKAVQWLRWGDLQAPAREVPVTTCVGRACMWGEAVVNCLLAAVQKLLAKGSGREQRLGPQLLRALTAVLPATPRWDVAIVTEVVRELDELAGAGVGDTASGSIELLEHHCTLLKLALHRDMANSSTVFRDADHELIGEVDAVADSTGETTLQTTEAPSLLGVLNQGSEWRGKYKLKRHTNTWAKSKWHMELRLTFRTGGGLDVLARWPKFLHPSTGQSARWELEDGGGIAIEFDLELPGGRREGGRTRDCEVFTWKGRLVQSRGCPHLEGTASGRNSDLKYEWYVVPPDPLALLRAVELDLLGKQDEGLPRPFSLLSFNTGFMEQKAEHFSNTLGISKLTKSDGTARDLAVAAVAQLSRYQHISGPREVAKVTKQSSEENWGMHDSLEEDSDMSGAVVGLDERWCSVEEVFGDSSSMRSASEIMAYLRREEKQLRHALLMRLLQVMLAHRPANTAIAESFPEAAAREAFFKRALRLPDAGAVLQRCTEDFAASGDVARSALTVAVEGLLTPFMAGGISTLTVESDHDYHPNEDWVFRLSIPGASRMKLKFDSRCKMENTRDFLQFHAERDPNGNLARRLHTEEKLCGQYPTGFPDLFLPGDHVWMKFQSDGSQEFWGFRFTLSAEGGGGGAAAVPFPAALKLLVAIANALSDEDRHGVQLMGSSVLLSVAATQPLSDEATRAAEAMCELLPEPCQWSDLSWCAALSLMSVAERNGRRQLLASLVTLLSTQMGVRPSLNSDVPIPLSIDYVSPCGAGVLLHGRMTLVASTGECVSALGLPVPLLARAGHALFCVRIESTSAASASLAIGITVANPSDECNKDELLECAMCCDVSSFALPGSELSVEMRRQGAGGDVLQLVVSGQNGSAHCDLPSSARWRETQAVLPVLRAEGFGAAMTLQSSPSVSLDSEAAAARLCQLQRTSRLVEACRGARDVTLPAALVVGAWARREGGDEANVSAVQERLRAKCTVVAESDHNHTWGFVTQKLEVPDAPALELVFQTLDIAEGYRLRITHDAAGELPVMRLCKSADDGAIKHTIECGKYVFATLDSADPELREKAQQENWCRIPAGWELAPGQPEVVQEVIAKHRWATETIIVCNGDAFFTLNHEDGSKAGQPMGKDKLSTRGAESVAEYRPNGACGRVLVRRLKPGLAGGGTTSVLKPEDLAHGESVLVPGSSVYVHGPVPQARRWDPVASSDTNSGTNETAVNGDLSEGTDPVPMESATSSPPYLCAGPWVWAMSPTHYVKVILTPEGDVRLDKTNLEMMTAEEVEIVRDVMNNVGDAAVQPDASWIEPEKLRLASLTGSWKSDSKERTSLKIKLEGADDLGTAELLFASNSVPSRDDDLVNVVGEVAHTRWGRHKVSFEGRTALPGKLSSKWKWPVSQEPAIEVQLVGCIDPPSALRFELLMGSQLPNAGSSQDVYNEGTSIVRRSLVLADGEHVEKVYGNSNISMGRVWMEVLTNRDRKISWPTADEQSDCFPRSFEHSAPEYCEVISCTPDAASGPESLSFRPLALVQTSPIELQRLPDGLWEGFLDMNGQRRRDVRWQLTPGSRGTFDAMLSGHSAQANSSDASVHGTFSNTGHVEIQLMSQVWKGRCSMDAMRRLCMVLVNTASPGCAASALRMVMCSKSCSSTWECTPPIIDGPTLVYRAYAKAPSKYFMHTARDAWTQQVAADAQVAEVTIRQLGTLAAGNTGLAVGVANPHGGSLDPLTSWPSDVSGRWLWRSDGAIAHATAGEQRSALWAFGVGDTVGFAVSQKQVSFLKNGDRVHTVPRHVRGEAEPMGRGGTPVFVVGLGCDVVLELRKGVQYPHLCEGLQDAFFAVAGGDGIEADTELTQQSVCSRQARHGKVKKTAGKRAGLDCTILSHDLSDPELSWKVMFQDGFTDWFKKDDIEEYTKQAHSVSFRAAALAVLMACKVVRRTLKGPAVWAYQQKDAQAADVTPSNGLSDADVWVQTSFASIEGCLSKGQRLIDEFGGERSVKEAIVKFQGSQSKPIEFFSTIQVADISDLYVNDMTLDGSVVSEGKISARFKKGSVEKFCQVHLKRIEDAWKVTEFLGERSGRTSPCEVIRQVMPGMEVVAAVEEDGWIKVVGAGTPARPLWYPIEDSEAGSHFARKKSFVVSETPCFSRPALVSVGRNSAAAPDATANSEAGVLGLPTGLDPYTVEACIRVPKEESGKEMCIVAWGAEGELDQGLSLLEGFASASCSLKGSRKVCDGSWHHIACTFDGRVRRLWADYEQPVEDVVTTARGADHSNKEYIKIGAYTTGLRELRSTPGTFRGEMKQLRIWKAAMTPAALKAFACKSERDVHEEVCMEAAGAIFKELDAQGKGMLRHEDIKIVFGGTCGSLLSCLEARQEPTLARDDWLSICRRLKASHGDSCLMRFLQACARNLGQLGRPVQVQSNWSHPVELPLELGLVSNSFGWLVQAKPTSLSDAMLEHIKDEGLEQFRRQVCVAHALLGRSADEAVVELADRVALQQGNHDDCWTKMLAVADWSQAQPRWMEQAVAHARLEDLNLRAKLQQVLAWALASGKPLADALEEPFKGRADDPKVEEFRRSAESAGGSAEACEALATELMAQDSTSIQSAVEAMFQEVVSNMLFFRFLILLELNWDVGRDFLPLIDLAAPADSAYGRLLAQVKPRLLGHLKFSQFQRVLASTKYEGSTPIIILNRKLALTVREKGRVDWEFRKSLIGQFMAEFRKQSIGPKLFRRPWQSRCTKVQFKGEGGEDAGGLYREALDAVAQELHSRAVPLFVPCPNAIAEVGDNRDAWCMNPRATAPECIRALEFVGQLLGLALRTGDLLPLTFAPFTWKGIVGDERTRDDVRSIDVFAEKHLAILSGDQRPSEEALDAMGGLQFAYPDVTGEEIELVEGGREISVTAENASEFAQLLLRNRLTFDRIQLQALRRGLATVVPIQLIRLWSWRDLQERVCGVPEVDLENLKRHTTYKNCASSSEHVKFMWEALESFTQKQRRSFLRFVWGRSSLPTVERWERNFTVQLLSGTDDSRLPCSHTCFFTLDLPMYSTSEVCHAKLLYCITNCLAIDADGAAARSLNWDEDDED